MVSSLPPSQRGVPSERCRLPFSFLRQVTVKRKRASFAVWIRKVLCNLVKSKTLPRKAVAPQSLEKRENSPPTRSPSLSTTVVAKNTLLSVPPENPSPKPRSFLGEFFCDFQENTKGFPSGFGELPLRLTLDETKAIDSPGTSTPPAEDPISLPLYRAKGKTDRTKRLSLYSFGVSVFSKGEGVVSPPFPLRVVKIDKIGKGSELHLYRTIPGVICSQRLS